MGYTVYSASSRAETRGATYAAATSVGEIFTQSGVQKIHESMEPSKALLRESRDSKNHPHSIPIIIALDTTGSMLHIPLYLVKEGLPKMVSSIIESGVPNPHILFLGVGDHVFDKAPLQVGQFESGDEELDMWLTRVWLERGGGTNDGESYSLAWYFAANHTQTDAWDKRKEKGFLFTIGDEPYLKRISLFSMKEIMGIDVEVSLSAKDLLKAAKERYNVYHLHMLEGSNGRDSLEPWKELLGQNCVVVNNKEDVSSIIAKIVAENSKKIFKSSVSKFEETPTSATSSEFDDLI